MAKPTLTSVHEKLTTIQLEIDELKDKKVNKSDMKYELDAINKDVAEAKTDLARINAYGRWFTILVGGALITALLNLLLRTK